MKRGSDNMTHKKQLQTADPAPPYFTEVRQISDTYGVTWHTAQGWTKKAWFPKRTRKGWDRVKVNAAVEDHQRAEHERLTSGGDKARKTSLECKRLQAVIDREKETLEIARLNTLRARGAVMSTEDHTRAMLRLCDLFVAGLQALEQRVGSETRDARVTAIVAEQCVRLRQELSEKAGKEGA